MSRTATLRSAPAAIPITLVAVLTVAGPVHAHARADAGPAAPPPARVLARRGPTLEAGARGVLSLVWLEAPARDLPLEVRLEAEPGLVVLGNRLGWADVVDPGADLPRIEAHVRAGPEPGVRRVRAHVRYWVCDDELCWLRETDVTWTVSVTAPRDGEGAPRPG